MIHKERGFNMDTFAKRLRIAMDDRGMRQADIIKATGMTSSKVSQYLSGKRSPKQDAVYLIASVLSVSAEWLMCKSDNMERQAPSNHVRLMPDIFDRLDSADKKALYSYAVFLLSQPKYQEKGETAVG